MSIQHAPSAAVNAAAASTATGDAPLRRTLLGEVSDRLVEVLLTGELEPGSPLRIDTLARDWHVSPTPVREALARAESSGLVVRRPLRGYQVAPMLPPEEFGHLMDLRLLLEPHCAAVAAEQHDADLVHRLEQQQEAMRSSPRGPTAHEYRQYLQADVAFHEALAATTGNRFLQQALALCGPHVHRFRRFRPGGVDDAHEALAEHAAVLDAVRAAAPEQAAEAMRAHLAGVRRRALAAQDDDVAAEPGEA